MRISYYLDRPSTESTSVILNVAFRGHRFRFGTGVVIPVKYWNLTKQEPRSNSPAVNSERKRLEVIETFVRTLHETMNFGDKHRAVTVQDVALFKLQVNTFLTPPTLRKVADGTSGFQRDFQLFIDTYTIRSSSGMLTSQRPGERSLQLYRRTLNSLNEWSAFAKRPLSYDNIDEDFYKSYVGWLATHCELTDASAGNYIKNIKTFMKWARQKAYHNSMVYETFYRDKRTGDTIALTVDELRRIRDLDFSGNLRLARTRDLFLVQCYTGMRYGDLCRLEPRHFDDSAGLIRYVTEKTDTRCIVPITRPLADVLERYPSRLFEFPSGVKQNKYIKEVAALAGMSQPVTISQYVSSKRVEEVFRRDELVTTHVARRTFVTTSLHFGVPEAVVSAVTGHSAQGVLQQHYAKFDEEGIRDIIVRAWDQL